MAFLSQPRQQHTVDVYLHQRTAADSQRVAAIDAGDYVNLTIDDPAQGLSVSELAIVLYAEHLDGALRSPVKRLTLLATGHAAPVTYDPVFFGSTANPVFFGSTADPVFAR